MKNRISKILGIGLALILALALVAGFALPVAAAETINEWQTFAYPDAGEDDDWFRDADIRGVGPMAEAINGDLYVYASIGPVAELTLGTWSDTRKVSGSSSALLDSTASDLHATVDFIPAAGTILTDADTVAELANFDFWYYEAAGLYGPHLELKFSDGTDIVDLTFMVQWRGERDKWTMATCGTDADFQAYNIWDGSTAIDYFTLASFVTAVGNLTDAQKAYTLTRVRVELYPGGGDRTLYTDDVTIDGITYNLEGPVGTSDDGTAEVSYLFLSDDEGRTWTETAYTTDTSYIGIPEPVVILTSIGVGKGLPLVYRLGGGYWQGEPGHQSQGQYQG